MDGPSRVEHVAGAGEAPPASSWQNRFSIGATAGCPLAPEHFVGHARTMGACVRTAVLVLVLTAAACGGEEFSVDATGGAGGTASGGAAGTGAGTSGGAAGSGGTSGLGGTAGMGATAGSGGVAGGSGSGGAAGGGNCVMPSRAKPAPTNGEEVLAITDDKQPEYPVIDGGYVYWTTDTTLWRIDVGGTCLQALATGGAQMEGVAIHSGYAYVADSGAGTIRRVPVAGGPSSTIVSGQAPVQTVAVDDTHVYWPRPGAGIGRKPKDGSGSGFEIIAAGGTALSRVFAVAVDADYVFVATRTPELLRMNKAAGSPVTVLDTVSASGINQNDPVYIALFGNRVYWTHWLNSPDSGAVRSVTRDGQNLVQIAEVHPEGIVTDGSAAYWTVGYPVTGRIRKGFAALTTASDLIVNQDRPRGVAIDNTHVYWTNFDDDTLRRAPR